MNNDPYEAFFDWCMTNGFRDVAECEPEAVDVQRMNEAVDKYGETGKSALTT